MNSNTVHSPRYSNFSLRYPRSLREAFGPMVEPYTIADARRDRRPDRLLDLSYGIALVLVVALLASSWI